MSAALKLPRTRVEHQATAELPIVVHFPRAGGLTTEAFDLADANALLEQLRDAIVKELRVRASTRAVGH